MKTMLIQSSGGEVLLGAAQYNHSLLMVLLGAAQYNHSLLLVLLGAAQYNQSTTSVSYYYGGGWPSSGSMGQ